MKGVFQTIEDIGTSVFRDRGSRFLGFVFPVSSVTEVHEILEEYRKRYHDARHHCYAYRLGSEGDEWRINDDGEPSGSAGKPIYGQFLSHEVTNVLGLVIRYFGGTKLGVPGLINAYRTATKEALATTPIIEGHNLYMVRFLFSYPDMDKVMRIIKGEQLEITDIDMGMDCTVFCRIPEILREKIGALTGDGIEVIWTDPG
jgi:uncharacterized YigZ family protein